MLVLHRAERADLLADLLGDLLADPLPDPMAAELVSVPTRGVERWLTQQLAGRLGRRVGRADGVCANVELPFPGALVRRILAEVGGEDPVASAWTPERLTWPLLALVDAHEDEPWLAPLADHLRAAADGGERRRLGYVRHLADLYDRYGVHRPELLLAWADGGDGGIPPASAWQAELWRRLRAELGVPSPAEQLQERCALLRRGEAALTVPDRLALFGLTRLPGSHLEVLAAVAAARDVHLFLLHPSPALWERLDGRTLPPGGRARRDDRSGDEVRHPILASWGRDAREMQMVLAAEAATGDHRPVVSAPRTLLEQLQHDVRHDLAPPGPPLSGRSDARLVVEAGDESVQVHACHGRARQVEVARDAVLHLLSVADDLEPRDVIVLCPDVEAFAPLVDAAFAAAPDPAASPERGPDEGTDDRLVRLPVRVADRSLRQTNPLLELAARLLELAGARMTASQVLDLAGRPPVRRRFGLGDDDLRQMERWVGDAGIRWGLDAGRRQPFGLAGVAANTWSAGLDRIALGAAMAEEDARRFAGVLPLDDVPPGELLLVGRLAELVDRLGEVASALDAPKPVGTWCAALADAVDAVGAVTDADSWQRGQLGRILGEVLDEATGRDGPSAALVSRPELVELLGSRLAGRPSRANFRTGEVTLCTLVPMRAVPHRVVVLLGIDDGVFPRSGVRDGDDLLLLEPRVGERDPRSEERQLLLDAVLSATEHLVVTYSGRDERTNVERPPAVPIGELLEAIDATAVAADGSPASAAVLVHHPLQPFDRRNFTVGAIRPGRPFGFDPTSFDGARALGGDRRARPAFLAEPLGRLDEAAIDLADLERFLRHPVSAFLRRRLGFVPAEAEPPIDDGVPVELDGLARWAVGDRLLAARLAGVDLDEAVAAERARGALPPGALADSAVDPIAAAVDTIVGASGIDGPGDIVAVDVVLPSGARLVGAVSDLHAGVVRRAVFSRLAGGHRLLGWLHLLALTTADPARPWSAVTVGRVRKLDKDSPADVTVATLDPLAAAPGERRRLAERHLEVLVDLYGRGLCEPLPLYPKTSLAWAEAVRRRHDPVRAARDAWRSAWRVAGEDGDRSHQEVHGGLVDLEALLLEPPRADEQGDGWADDESSRLGCYARRLWDGLLAHEHLEDR